MLWTTKNYPISWKNLDPITRKKAIDIANAMLLDGYKEDQAIPIATAQAEKWKKTADAFDLAKLEHKDVTKHKVPTGPSGARLMDDNVIVRYSPQQKEWMVISEEARNADSYQRTKVDAVKRAKEIAAKRGTKVLAEKKLL